MCLLRSREAGGGGGVGVRLLEFPACLPGLWRVRGRGYPAQGSKAPPGHLRIVNLRISPRVVQ